MGEKYYDYKKRITVILLTFAMISTLVFAGCKDGNSNTSTEATQKAEKLETDANSESISTKEGEAETTESYEPATIRIGVSTGRTPHLSNPDDSNLRFIARLERTATYALYADPDKVSSLEDLKGKSIALQLGTIAEYFNINALAEVF